MNQFDKKRVVVTGLGPVTAIGLGADAFLQGQHAVANGIRTIQSFDPSNLTVHIAGEVDIEITDYISKKDARRLDRFVHHAVIAAELARQHAGLSVEDIAGEHTGTCVGSGIGGIATWKANADTMIERGAMRMSPFFIPMLIANMASGQVAMQYGLTGPSSAVVTACATGSGAIGDAFRIIQRGEASIMFAGGTEAVITEMGIASFAVMKALSTRNDEPETASRPFTASRDGFVMGEGAGVVILEEYEHAKARNATIYAEVVGYGTSADAYHITAPAPGGKGAVRCIQATLADAGINPDAIGYINAHGTSTPANDLNETLAYKSVFAHGGNDDTSTVPPISSTKSMIGHTLGAAGGIEAIATIQALHSGVLPPTKNYLEPDPELDLDYIPNEPREAQVDYALSTNFAFGGQNAALIFKRAESA